MVRKAQHSRWALQGCDEGSCGCSCSDTRARVGARQAPCRGPQSRASEWKRVRAWLFIVITG